MAGKVRTWVWVVAGIVIVGILGLVAMVALGLYFFSQHVDSNAASPAEAAGQFEEIRARFSGQKPLIELDARGEFLRANPDRPAPQGAATAKQLHVLVFDPDDEGRLVRVTLPFWLLRLNPRGSTIDFNGTRMDLEDLKLTVEDLERFGPTLIIDHANPRGERVLVWSH